MSGCFGFFFNDHIWIQSSENEAARRGFRVNSFIWMQDNLLICVKRHACVHSSDHNGHTLNITSSPDFNSSVLKTYNIHAHYKMYRRNTWLDMKIIRMDVPPPLSFFFLIIRIYLFLGVMLYIILVVCVRVSNV